MGMALITGGARSGKSSLAVRIASRWHGAVTFIATAEARDDEMRSKIARHRADRPDAWRVVEEPIDLEAALEAASSSDLVIVDCLTLWVSNLLERGVAATDVEERAAAAAKTAAARGGPVLVVTNEVGDGIVPMDPVTRAYRDLMGTVNATFGREATRALLVVAGRIVTLTDPEEVIGDVLGG
jgi:adenosylcobinamide kinase / adenosylcobinamide-phosphate guanylyltransferase